MAIAMSEQPGNAGVTFSPVVAGDARVKESIYEIVDSPEDRIPAVTPVELLYENGINFTPPPGSFIGLKGILNGPEITGHRQRIPGWNDSRDWLVPAEAIRNGSINAAGHYDDVAILPATEMSRTRTTSASLTESIVPSHYSAKHTTPAHELGPATLPERTSGNRLPVPSPRLRPVLSWPDPRKSIQNRCWGSGQNGG